MALQEADLEMQHGSVPVTREYEGGATSGPLYPRRALDNFQLMDSDEDAVLPVEAIAEMPAAAGVVARGTWHATEAGPGSESPPGVPSVRVGARVLVRGEVTSGTGCIRPCSGE